MRLSKIQLFRKYVFHIPCFFKHNNYLDITILPVHLVDGVSIKPNISSCISTVTPPPKLPYFSILGLAKKNRLINLSYFGVIMGNISTRSPIYVHCNNPCHLLEKSYIQLPSTPVCVSMVHLKAQIIINSKYNKTGYHCFCLTVSCISDTLSRSGLQVLYSSTNSLYKTFYIHMHVINSYYLMNYVYCVHKDRISVHFGLSYYAPFLINSVQELYSTLSTETGFIFAR